MNNDVRREVVHGMPQM